MAAVDLHRVAVDGADGRAKLLQNLQNRGNVGDLGDVFDPADPVHQQSGGDDSHSGIFGAADVDLTGEPVPAVNL